MTISPLPEHNQTIRSCNTNMNNNMSSHSISLQDLAASSTTDSGNSSLTPTTPMCHSKPQHELNVTEDFSDHSEELFAAPVSSGDSNNEFAHSNGSSSGFSSGFEDVNFEPTNPKDFIATSGSTGYNSGAEESWTSYNDYNDVFNDRDDNNSWITKGDDSSDVSTDSELLKHNSAPAGFRRLSTAHRKTANGPFVWVLREGIDGMEQAARLVLSLEPTTTDYSTLAQDDDVEIQWRNDGSFDWVSREDIRMVQNEASSGQSSQSNISTSGASASSRSVPSREEMIANFNKSDLSSSGRWIMRTQDNIITSDFESSESSEGTVEDEEELPTFGRKIGNMMGFRSSNSSGIPKRSSSTNIKRDPAPSSAGATPSRKRSLPAFPLSSPLRRSSSIGKKSLPAPPITISDALDGSGNDGQIKPSSFHHEQRRARKGAKKQAFKSKSADSMPAELEESPILVKAKSLSNSLDGSSIHSSKSELKPSSYHHEQRKKRKGAKKKAIKSKSADSQPAELFDSPTMSDAKTLWQEMHASSPEILGSPPPWKNESFHHEQRKVRKGARKKAFQSRSADSQPAELMESPIIAEARALSSSMHSLQKPESMKVSSFHHEQRRKRKGSKTKHQKSKSADSMPDYMGESPIIVEAKSLSGSAHGPRRKRSLSRSFRSPTALMKRSISSIKTSPKNSDSKSNKLKGSNHSKSLSSADFMTPEQVPKKKTVVRKSESEVIGSSPNPRRNTSLRRSEGDFLASPNETNSTPSKLPSVKRIIDNAAADLTSPKRNSSMKRNNDVPDADFVSPRQRKSSIKRSSDVSPKRNSSLRNKSPRRSTENSGIAYLQNKKKSQQQPQAPSRRSGASALSSPITNSRPRKVANVESALSITKSSNRSIRQLDGLGDTPGRNRVSNVDSAILLMKKQTSQRKLDAVGEKNKGRKASNTDAAIAVMKKKRSPKQSASSRLLGTKNDVDLPSPQIQIGTGRQHRSSGSILNAGDQEFDNSFVARADKLQISPNQTKRANLKSKLDVLTDKMSLAIGVEASPDMRLRKRNSTLREKRAASKQSRKKLTNAFQRMIQPDGTEATANDGDDHLEVPMNN